MKYAKVLGKVIVCAVIYLVGLALIGALSAQLHFPTVRNLPEIDPQHAFLITALASPLLILGLLPLAGGLRGGWLTRGMAIAAVLYVTLGLNTLLELQIFSTLLEGNAWIVSLPWLVSSALTAAAITYCFRGNPHSASIVGSFGPAGWVWRLVAAWLAFPICYFLFGMCVGPIVVRYYDSTNSLGLHIPPMAVIARTVLVRSATFLAASLPVILLWTKSRARLVVALGLAHAMTVGIFQLLQGTFLPAGMRIAHAIEITCDSFAYAAILAWLFTESGKAAELNTTEIAIA